MKSVDPVLDFLAPTQTVCNYVTLFFRNISSLLSEGDKNGTWQRFIIVTTPQGPNNEGGPSSGPANGPTVDNHLHTNPYPNTAAPGPAEGVRGGQRAVPERADRDRPTCRAPSRRAPRATRRTATDGPASRRNPRRSNAFVGPDGALVAVLIMYFGFTKDIPFTHGYILKAQFESANSIRPELAGADRGRRGRQGQVGSTGVEGSNAALLVMELKDTALPLHKNATAKIRPRIFLEGNFFVDLKPGTPDSPQLDSGDTIAITQTSTPVQLDQVLTSLQSDSREDLQNLLKA